jgi:post-segregation antitoxin (ccd killing protein)
MRRQRPSASTKRPTKRGVRGDLLAEAKWKKWLRDNREAIAAYNEYVEKNGMFSDGVRKF